MVTRIDQLIRSKLEETRKALIDTGLRQNRLLHHNRQAKGKKHLTLFSKDVDSTFAKLWDGKARIGFLDDQAATARERQRERTGGIEVDETTGEDEAELLPAPRPPASATMLQSRFGRNALEDRLAKLRRDAKDIEEEQGVNTLFLAIGFLKWKEDPRADKELEAPLILIPVQLHHDVRRSTVDMTVRDDDLNINFVLQEKLTAFQVKLPDFPEKEDSDKWAPSSYFDLVQDAISSKPGWGIDREGIELGFFSFGKLLMYGDLDPDAWKEQAILSHPLVRGLLHEGFDGGEPELGEATDLDAVFRPTDLFHVVDCDSSQARVIESVRRGQNLVVQGPPGTGKSQTIANILAACAHDGKRILFVAEKVAALDVVKSRLEKVGLAPLCLEIHSKSANKGAVAKAIKDTIDLKVESVAVRDPNVLIGTREWLNHASSELHATVGLTGLSAYRALGVLTKNDPAAYRNEFAFDVALNWSPDVRAAALATAQKLDRVIINSGALSSSPWTGVTNLSLEPPALGGVQKMASELVNRLEHLSARVTAGFTAASLSVPETFAETAQTLRVAFSIAARPDADYDVLSKASARLTGRDGAAKRVAEQLAAVVRRANDTSVYTRLGLEAAHDTTIPVLARGAQSFFARWSGAYRRAVVDLKTWVKAEVPKNSRQRLTLAEGARQQAEFIRAVRGHDSSARSIFGNIWQGLETDLDALLWHGEAIEVLAKERAGPEALLALARQDGVTLQDMPEIESAYRAAEATFDEMLRVLGLDPVAAFGADSLSSINLSLVTHRLSSWITAQEAYYQYCEARQLADELEKRFGIADFAAAIVDRTVSDRAVAATFEKEIARVIWNRRASEAEAFLRASGQDREEKAETFRAAEVAHIETTPKRILMNHLGRMPRGAQGHMHTIRNEASKKRRLLPIRKLIAGVGSTLQQIKPIWMMSPISVSAFVPPGSVDFDVLVIDEASQVRPEDAIGLVARSRQIVVFGDSKQLPPTSFFARALADEDDTSLEDDTTEFVDLSELTKINETESILKLCDARGLPSQMLQWHYRSRHPSLIRVSADAFYSDLIMPPAAMQRGETGFLFRKVNGAYGRGTTQCNDLEAKEVAKALVLHAETTPHLSVGVATFSIKQRDAVTKAIDDARRTSDALDTFIRNREVGEYLFVKSIEMVQGDERDVMLISVGYGPRTAGARLESMAFGPVATEGGERRLNVLFTRARYRCEVFCSFEPEDIDTNRPRSQGVALLKRYLIYARDGVLEKDFVTADQFDSPFEEEVAEFIRKLGYKVDTQVGVSGFRIDLAVSDPDQPGRHMLAVEADGATYHSALWARERDRLRQAVLEGMGWRFYRIWSTDWFYRRSQAEMRLKQALENARRVPPPDGQPAPLVQSVLTIVEAAPDISTAAGTIPYTVGKVNLLDTRSRTIEERDARKVFLLVEEEGPIHIDELARRYAAGHDRKATEKVINEVRYYVRSMTRVANTAIIFADSFVMTNEQMEKPVVRRRDTPGIPSSVLKPEMLPPTEIDAAILIAIANNGPMNVDDLVRATAYVFGFQKAGSAIAAVIRKRVDALLAGKTIAAEQGMISVIVG